MTRRAHPWRVIWILAPLVAALSASDAAAQAQEVRVLTYNVKKAATDAPIQAQVDVIAGVTPRPQVLSFQEFSDSSAVRNLYVTKLNAAYGVSSWRVAVSAKHCDAGTEPNCTLFRTEGVAILTMLPPPTGVPSPTGSKLMWYSDFFWPARATVWAQLALADGTPITVWGCHLPVNWPDAGAPWDDRGAERAAYIQELKDIAADFPTPRLFGGDFNLRPSWPEYPGMTTTAPMYVDAWTVAGNGGAGYTAPAGTPTKRIDYWFSDKDGAATAVAGSAVVVNAPTQSDHRPLYVRYTVQPPPPGGETLLYADDFNASTLNETEWQKNDVWSGTDDLTVPLQQINGRLEIGPLTQGSTGASYRGIGSKTGRNFSRGYAYVQLTQPPPSTQAQAFAMFAVGFDQTHYYRYVISGGNIWIEKREGGDKIVLPSRPFDPVNHAFLKISHDQSTGDVVWETSPTGAPGSWSPFDREVWNVTAIPLDSSKIKFEMKAGTSGSITGQYIVSWDNFRAARLP